jgi:hypothetical protein
MDRSAHRLQKGQMKEDLCRRLGAVCMYTHEGSNLINIPIFLVRGARELCVKPNLDFLARFPNARKIGGNDFLGGKPRYSWHLRFWKSSMIGSFFNP